MSMDLSPALGIQRRDVVVFVGAGGKTTAMFRAARELAAQGWRTVTTTTTRIGQDELRLTPHYLMLGEPPRLPVDFASVLAAHRNLFVFSDMAPPNKARGVSPGWLDEHLARHTALDVVLVEADGSRQLPLKAPRPHEPPIPSLATLVVPIASLSALGQPLDEEHIFGAALIAARTGHPPGEPITAALIATILGDGEMGLKDVPPGARVVPLLNSVADEALPAAREIAGRLLLNPRISHVVIAGVADPDAPPVREVRRRVVGVVLAAGLSERMGEAKLLLPWGEGSTLIREVCRQVVASGLPEVLVATGAWREQVEAQIAGLPVRAVYNPRYEQGEMISSLQAALDATPEGVEAALVFLGDQPRVEPAVVAGLLTAYAEGRGRLIAPVYEGQRGHPVLLDRAYWGALRALPPDGAPRDVLRAHGEDVYELPVDTPSVLQDIDTPDDYQRARGRGV